MENLERSVIRCGTDVLRVIRDIDAHHLAVMCDCFKWLPSFTPEL